MIRQHLCNLIVSVLLVWLCFGAFTSFAEQVFYVNNTSVNLRSGPTTKTNNILATVPKDTPVVVLSQQGTWNHVRLPDGREGWISSWVLVSRDQDRSRGTRIQGLSQPTESRNAPAPDISGEMILIPGGTAIVGSDDNEVEYVVRTWQVSRDALKDELPKRKVTMKGFYIDQYEVTNAQYKQFVAATRYPPPLHWKEGTYAANTGNHPVTFVAWDDAYAYAQWAGKRLPTDEEWEIAARGLYGQRFPWGDVFAPQQANMNNPEGNVAPVGSHQNDVSAYKVYDMGGNVMEWTLTQYGGDKDYFILKGSSWLGKPFEARGANQTPGTAEYRLGDIGFRCAKSVMD